MLVSLDTRPDTCDMQCKLVVSWMRSMQCARVCACAFTRVLYVMQWWLLVGWCVKRARVNIPSKDAVGQLDNCRQAKHSLHLDRVLVFLVCRACISWGIWEEKVLSTCNADETPWDTHITWMDRHGVDETPWERKKERKKRRKAGEKTDETPWDTHITWMDRHGVDETPWERKKERKKRRKAGEKTFE